MGVLVLEFHHVLWRLLNDEDGVEHEPDPDPGVICSDKCYVCGERWLVDSYSICCALCRRVFHRDCLAYSSSNWSCQDDLSPWILKFPCHSHLKDTREVPAYETYHWLLSSAASTSSGSNEPSSSYNKNQLDIAMLSTLQRLIEDGCLEQVCNWCRDTLETVLTMP